MVVQRDPRCRYTEGRMAEARSATPVLDLRLPSPVEELHDDVPARHGVSLYLKRDDLAHVTPEEAAETPKSAQTADPVMAPGASPAAATQELVRTGHILAPHPGPQPGIPARGRCGLLCQLLAPRR